MVMPEEIIIAPEPVEPIVIPPRPKPEPITKAQTVTVVAAVEAANALAMAAYDGGYNDVKAMTRADLRARLIESERLAARAEFDRRYAAAAKTVDALMAKIT